MIQSEIDQAENVEEFDIKIQEMERLTKKFKSVLHPRNVYMTSLKHSLIQLYGRAPGYTFDDLPDILLERKIELCRQVLQVVDVVKPGINRFRGKLYYFMTKHGTVVNAWKQFPPYELVICTIRIILENYLCSWY